jgi:hypothetical protein
MNCSEFQQRLEQAVEAHGPTAGEQAALAEHLASCPTDQCGRLWQQTALIANAVRCWKEEVDEVDLTDCVLVRLSEEDAVRRGREAALTLEPRYAFVREPAPVRSAGQPSSRLWVSMVTLAAALLLVLSVLTLRGPATRDMASLPPASADRLVAADEVPQGDLAAGPAGGPHGRLAGTYASMPLSATQFLTDAVVLVVPADLSDPEEEPSPADVWADRLGKRWEPIGRELNRSLELLMEAVPRTESAS